MDSSIDRVFLNLPNEDLNDIYIADNIFNNLFICIEDNLNKDYIIKRLEKIKNYRIILDKLRLLPIIEQRSEEWYNIRQTMISASDFGQALNKGDYGTQKELIIKKVTNKSKDITYKAPLLWGVKYEEVATRIYQKRNNVRVFEFGLIKHNEYEFIGASPDGISELGIMLEIKCPFKRKISGKILDQYYYQIQGQLEVCDLEECDFLECEISEYETEKDFIADTYNDFILTKDLKEKGIVISYKNIEDEDFSYYYSNINDNINNMITWKNNIVTNFDIDVEYKVEYWKLIKYNNQRVYRDRDFFNKNIDNLKFIWDKILFYRNNNKKFIKDIVNNKNSKGKIYEFNKRDNDVVINGFAIKKTTSESDSLNI